MSEFVPCGECVYSYAFGCNGSLGPATIKSIVEDVSEKLQSPEDWAEFRNNFGCRFGEKKDG